MPGAILQQDCPERARSVFRRPHGRYYWRRNAPDFAVAAELALDRLPMSADGQGRGQHARPRPRAPRRPWGASAVSMRARQARRCRWRITPKAATPKGRLPADRNGGRW